MNKEKQMLKAQKSADYLKQITSEYQDRPLTEVYPYQIRALQYVSVLPNLISFATASGLLWYLCAPIAGRTKYLALCIGFILLAGLELGKRMTANNSAKRAALGRSFYASGIGLGILITASMFLSFKGGEQIVLENSTPPTLAAPAEIGQMEEELAALNQSIKRQESTTWKGVITVDANRNLKPLYRQKEALTQALAEARASHQNRQDDSDNKHQAQTADFAIIFGSVALGMDIFLILIFVAIARRKSDLFALMTTYTGKTPKTPENGVSNVGNANYDNVYGDLLRAIKSDAKRNYSSYIKRQTPESQKKATLYENTLAFMAQQKAELGIK